MLFTCRSSSDKCSGPGRPSLELQVLGGHIEPLRDRVWKSFWVRESEEKHKRTRSLGASRGRADCFALRLNSRKHSSESVSLRVQKHVVRIISRFAADRAGTKLEAYNERPLPTSSGWMMDCEVRTAVGSLAHERSGPLRETEGWWRGRVQLAARRGFGVPFDGEEARIKEEY